MADSFDSGGETTQSAACGPCARGRPDLWRWSDRNLILNTCPFCGAATADGPAVARILRARVLTRRITDAGTIPPPLEG